MKNVHVLINGEYVDINVNERAEMDQLTNMSIVVAKNAVTDNGDYYPWMVDIGKAFIVLKCYTDIEIPDEWEDDDIMEFYDSYEWKTIEDNIDQVQLQRCWDWIDRMVDARLSLFFINPVPGIGALIGTVTNKKDINSQFDNDSSNE